jgi:hypothetical protein
VAPKIMCLDVVYIEDYVLYTTTNRLLMWHATSTVVAACSLKIIPLQLFTQVVEECHMKNHRCSGAPLPLQHYFAADATFTNHATPDAEKVFFNLKGQGPLIFKINPRRPNGKS